MTVSRKGRTINGKRQRQALPATRDYAHSRSQRTLNAQRVAKRSKSGGFSAPVQRYDTISGSFAMAAQKLIQLLQR